MGNNTKNYLAMAIGFGAPFLLAVLMRAIT
jgi:hypothetical protein